jgi:hypothetical protein
MVPPRYALKQAIKTSKRKREEYVAHELPNTSYPLKKPRSNHDTEL